MSPELEAELCERYPAIFVKGFLSTPKTAMGRGFGCEDGWFDLIDSLCAKLQAAVDAGEIRQPVADQVKQKFGELRFFAWPKVPLTESLIDAAREQSALTCEICGEPGVLRWQNGVQAICDVHALPGSRIVTAERSSDDGDRSAHPMSDQRSAAVARLVVQVTTMVRQSGSAAGFNPVAWVHQWIQNPVPALGNRKPGELLDTADGEQLVADVLARMQSGAYS